MTISAVIYCRISTDLTGEQVGVGRQEELCRAIAERENLTVMEVLVDNDESAYSRKRKRPAFERMLSMLTDGEVGAVIAYHADRLYRRTTDLERLVDVVEVTGAAVFTAAAGTVDLATASGRMVARYIGVAAQHESERMGERLRIMHESLAAKGNAPGGKPPYGYQWTGPQRTGATYSINHVESKALKFMVRRVLEGASLLAVARELDASGVKTREGRQWHPSSVRASIINPAVTGLRVHRREIAGTGTWKPIIDRPTWEEVRAVVTDPARKRTRSPWKYLLSGLVENPQGQQMNGRPDRAGDGSRTRRTYSTRPPAKPVLSVDADKLEALIVEAVLLRLDESPPLPQIEGPSSTGKEVAKIEQELEELATLRGNQVISLSEWLAAREPLTERLKEARRAAGTQRRPSPKVKKLSAPGAVRKAWGSLEFDTRREIIVATVEKVVVGPAKVKGRWAPVEDRLLPEVGGGVVWKL